MCTLLPLPSEENSFDSFWSPFFPSFEKNSESHFSIHISIQRKSEITEVKESFKEFGDWNSFLRGKSYGQNFGKSLPLYERLPFSLKITQEFMEFKLCQLEWCLHGPWTSSTWMVTSWNLDFFDFAGTVVELDFFNFIILKMDRFVFCFHVGRKYFTFAESNFL